MDNHNPDRGTGRRMLLLGGLSALALNEGARRKVVDGAHDLLGNAQEVLEDAAEKVKPALATAAAQAGQAAQQAGHTVQGATRTAAGTFETLREKAPAHAESLLDRAGDAAETVADKVTAAASAGASKAAEVAHDVGRGVRQGVEALGETAQDLAGDAEQSLRGARHEVKRQVRAGQAQGARVADRAAHAARAGRHQAEDLLDHTRERVEDELRTRKAQGARVAGKVAREVEAARRQAEQALRDARLQAERDLRVRQKVWSSGEIEREVRRQFGSLHGQSLKDLARLEKRGSKGRSARAEADGGGVNGGLIALLLLGSGAVVLARVPAARQAILGAVGRVSPEAAENLHRASRRAREIVGSVWIEHIEEPAPAPAPAAARGTQAGTTGATWGSSPAPGSSAASGGGTSSPRNPGDKPN